MTEFILNSMTGFLAYWHGYPEYISELMLDVPVSAVEGDDLDMGGLFRADT